MDNEELDKTGTAGADAEAPIARCPWCSAPLPSAVDTCPSCGAVLTPKAEEEIDGIPGVTEVDPKLLEYKPKPQKAQPIVDFLIQYVEEDEAAAAARQRLIRRPKKGTKGESAEADPESEEDVEEPASDDAEASDQ